MKEPSEQTIHTHISYIIIIPDEHEMKTRSNTTCIVVVNNKILANKPPPIQVFKQRTFAREGHLFVTLILGLVHRQLSTTESFLPSLQSLASRDFLSP